jgi:hypothetical protein
MNMEGFVQDVRVKTLTSCGIKLAEMEQKSVKNGLKM